MSDKSMKIPWRGFLLALAVLGAIVAVIHIMWAWAALMGGFESPYTLAGWWNLLIYSGPVLAGLAFLTVHIEGAL